MVSNYGRVWHKYEHKFRLPAVDTKGYPFLYLATENGDRIRVALHRLVMLTFCYYPGCENMLVNHKDGIKLNCFIWNLEWATFSENMIHAHENGLISNKRRYTDEQIHEICRLLELGILTYPQIAQRLDVDYHLVSSIQCKHSHTDISDQYDLQRRKTTANLTDDEVRELCKFFEDHPVRGCKNDICRAGLEAIGYPLSKQNSKLLKTSQKILEKRTYKYISRDYDF